NGSPESGWHLCRPLAGRRSGDPTEHRAGHQAGSAGIVEIEQASDKLTRGAQTGDGLAIGVDHAPRCVDFQPAEREGNSTRYGVSFERRLIDRVGPVRFVDGEGFGATAILDVRIELDVRAHRFVVGLDRFQGAIGVHVVEFFRQFFERVGTYLGDLLDAIFVTQHGNDLLVEDLPGELPWLHENDATVLRIGVISKIRAFVDEALTIGVDHYAPWIRMLLEIVADREIAEFRRVAIPTDRMTPCPVVRRDSHAHERT